MENLTALNGRDLLLGAVGFLSSLEEAALTGFALTRVEADPVLSLDLLVGLGLSDGVWEEARRRVPAVVRVEVSLGEAKRIRLSQKE